MSPDDISNIQVLEQRFQKLQSERDELHANFVTAVQEVVQKANFKKLLLERKVVALADSLEKKDAQVNSTFSYSGVISREFILQLRVYGQFFTN